MFATTPQVRVGALDALQIVRKTTGRQHHAFARANDALAIGPGDARSDHTTVFHQQLARGRGGVDRNLQVQRRLGQPRRQRIATGHQHAAPVEHQFLDVREQAFAHVDRRFEGLGGVEEMLEIGVGRVEHHADEGDGGQRRTQARHVLPQAADVERRGQDRAADVHTTVHIGVVVRVEGGDEFELGLAVEELDHLWPPVDEGLDRRAVEEGTGFSAHVAHDGFAAVLDAGLARLRAARNPEHPTGKRGGSAEDRCLLDHHHVQAVVPGADRGGQATGTRADHQHIALGDGG